MKGSFSLWSGQHFDTRKFDKKIVQFFSSFRLVSEAGQRQPEGEYSDISYILVIYKIWFFDLSYTI